MKSFCREHFRRFIIRSPIVMMIIATAIIGKSTCASEPELFDKVLAVGQFQALGVGPQRGLLAEIGRTFIIQEMKALLEPQGIKVLDQADMTPLYSRSPKLPRVEFDDQSPDYRLAMNYTGERGMIFANPSITVVASGETIALEQVVFDTSDLLASSRRAAAVIAAHPVLGLTEMESRVIMYRCFSLDEDVAEYFNGSVSSYELVIEMPKKLAVSAANLAGPDIVASEDPNFQKSRKKCDRDYWRPDSGDARYVLSGRYTRSKLGFVSEIIVLVVDTGDIRVIEVGPVRDIDELYYQMRKSLPTSISRVLRGEDR